MARHPAKRPSRPAARAALPAIALGLALACVPAAARLESLGRADRDALLDGFERDPWPDPGLWWVAPDAGWRPSACRARSGERALRAFAGPAGAPEPPCDAPVAPGAVSAAVMILDLRAATTANRLDLSWEMWPRLHPAPGAGLVLFLRVPRPEGGDERIPIFGATAQAEGWVYPVRQLDLRNLVDVRDPRRVFDLRGGRWEIEWVAAAPAGAPAGGGVAIDDVRLVWEPDLAVPSPTERPIPTAGPTRTPTRPTETPAPTDEPTPTRAPASATPTAPGALYLPMARRDPPEPTADASATHAAGTSEPTAVATETAAPLRRYLPALGASPPDPEPYPPPPWAASGRGARVIE